MHRWGPVPVPEAAVRKGLAPAHARDRAPARARSFRPGRERGGGDATGDDEADRDGKLRAATGLRSTWITKLVSLSVMRPGGAALFGRPVTLTGSASSAGAVLEQRVDGVWKRPGAPPRD